MELRETVLAFSPNVMKGKPKKKKASKTVSKLSLKNRSTPRPAPESSRSALSERNGDVNSSGGSRQSKPSDKCLCRRSKENCQPCQCAQLITSDSSEADDSVGNKFIASQQPQYPDLISEDEDIVYVESDAKTTVTKQSSSTYVTCVSHQVRKETVRRVIPDTSSDDEIEELQTSFSRTLILATPDSRSGVTDSTVNSCEKVEQWLKRIVTPDESVTIIREHVSETSSSDEGGTGSNAKESSSTYPTTQMSSRNSLFSDIESNHGTSRQSSSSYQNSSTELSVQLNFNYPGSNIQRNMPVHQPVQLSQPQSKNPVLTAAKVAATQYSQTSTNSSSDVFKVPRRSSRVSKDRESIISSITGSESQATSTSTRSSSQFFVDKPPWSKSLKKQATQKKKKPLHCFSLTNSLSDLSDIREQNESSHGSPRNVINLQNPTVSPEEDSFHLVYESTLSPQISPDINEPQARILPQEKHNNSASIPDTIPVDRSFTSSKSSVSQDENKSIPDTLPWPDSSNSLDISSPQCQEEYVSPHKVAPERVRVPDENESIPDTLPWPGSSNSHVITSSPRQKKNIAPDKASVERVHVPDATPSSSSDVFSWPLHTKSEIASILRQVEQKARKEGEGTPSIASTIPWPSDCDAPIYPPSKASTSKSDTSSSSPQESIEESHEQTLTSIRSSAIFSNSQYNGNINFSAARASSNEIIESSVKNSYDDNTPSPKIRVSISQSKSIIEISSDSDSETDEQGNTPGDTNDMSDSEEESPFRIFRRRPDRASYVEIVVSDTEEDEPEENSSKQQSSSDEGSDSPKCQSKTLNKTPIEIPSSGSDSDSLDNVRGHKMRHPKRISSTSPVEIFSSGGISERSSKSLLSSDNEDSQKTYFSEAQGATNLSRVPPDFDLPQISEDEEQPPSPAVVAKKLDFEAETSSDEEAAGPSGKPSEAAKPTRLSRTPQSPGRPRRPYTSSPESSDNDEQLEKFFENERKKREQAQRRHNSSSDDSPTFIDSPGFIVPDHAEEETSDADFEEGKGTESPAFYLRLLNDKRRAESELDKTWLPGKGKNNTKTHKTQATPTPTKGRQLPKTVGRQQPKPQYLGGAMFSPVLSFLASLSAANHQRCHPEAIPYIKRFSNTRLDLTARLFTMFNDKVFKNKLQQDMPITWNNRLSSTAGFCYNQRKPLPEGEYVRSSRIELSSKVISDAARLRDTLIHEMCHAATWVISGQLGGHGPVWKQWTWQARRHFPELPDIGRCHSYEVKTKYTYKCVDCGYSFGRHSKSLDLERKRCGLCRGQFQLLVHGTPAKGGKASAPRAPNVFAMFVRENYRLVKDNRKSLKHGDVMKMLSQKFAEHKITKQ